MDFAAVLDLPLNIKLELFAKITLKYFCKKFHHRCSTGVLTMPLVLDAQIAKSFPGHCERTYQQILIFSFSVCNYLKIWSLTPCNKWLDLVIGRNYLIFWHFIFFSRYAFKRLHHRCLTGFWVRLCIPETWYLTLKLLMRELLIKKYPEIYFI